MTIEDRVAALEARVRASEDELAILRLLATYGPAVDSGESQAAAELWASDGVYDVGGVSREQGHDAIAALYDADFHQSLIRQGSAHVTVTPQITLDGDRAVAVGYSIVFRRGEDGYAAWRLSANRWTLARTGDGWRIAERFNRVVDGSPESHDTLRAAVR
jgi:uncharacterized protein (TIGR02246 family)